MEATEAKSQITDELLRKLVEMWRAGDDELHDLAGTIYLAHNPTNDDIERISEIMGYGPLNTKLNHVRAEDIFLDVQGHEDILL